MKLRGARTSALVRAQLMVRAAKAGKGALADAISALDKQAAELEVKPKQFLRLAARRQTAGEFLQLKPALRSLLSVADSADAAPQRKPPRFSGELEGDLEKLTARWTKIRQQDIPALNTELKKAGLAAVDPNKSPGAAPSAMLTGTTNHERLAMKSRKPKI